MNTYLRRICAGALGALCLGLSLQAEPVLVAHKDLQGEPLTGEALKSVLLGKKTAWDSGGRVTLAVLKKGDVADAFLTQHAGLNASAFGNHWRRLAMTGGGIAPKSFDDEASLRDFVAATAGAIGFVDRASANDAVLVIAP